jgi:hypothetical protein
MTLLPEAILKEKITSGEINASGKTSRESVWKL